MRAQVENSQLRQCRLPGATSRAGQVPRPAEVTDPYLGKGRSTSGRSATTDLFTEGYLVPMHVAHTAATAAVCDDRQARARAGFVASGSEKSSYGGDAQRLWRCAAGSGAVRHPATRTGGGLHSGMRARSSFSGEGDGGGWRGTICGMVARGVRGQDSVPVPSAPNTGQLSTVPLPASRGHVEVKELTHSVDARSGGKRSAMRQSNDGQAPRDGTHSSVSFLSDPVGGPVVAVGVGHRHR